jgi:proteasome beta subunit
MDIEDGIELVIRAIKAAMERDTYSGNGIKIATVTKEEGFKILPDEEVEKKIKELS